MVLRGSDEVRSDAGGDRVVPPSVTGHEDAARRAECQVGRRQETRAKLSDERARSTERDERESDEQDERESDKGAEGESDKQDKWESDEVGQAGQAGERRVGQREQRRATSGVRSRMPRRSATQEGDTKREMPCGNNGAGSEARRDRAHR